MEAGTIDPLKVRVLCKTLSEIADKIDKGTKENQNTAAVLHGEKPFSFMGAELHYTATKTEYDYSVCGDSKLNDMMETLSKLEVEIEERKSFLKSLTEEFTTVNSDGEIKHLSKPNKKQSMGVKVSIK